VRDESRKSTRTDSLTYEGRNFDTLLRGKSLRKLPRREAVTIVRLLSNHHLLRGHFYKRHKQEQPPKEEQCRFCLSHLETPEHILFDCEEIYAMEQRSESDLNNLKATICHFFNQLQVEV
jgi:hypothetical protein